MIYCLTCHWTRPDVSVVEMVIRESENHQLRIAMSRRALKLGLVKPTRQPQHIVSKVRDSHVPVTVTHQTGFSARKCFRCGFEAIDSGEGSWERVTERFDTHACSSD